MKNVQDCLMNINKNLLKSYSTIFLNEYLKSIGKKDLNDSFLNIF